MNAPHGTVITAWIPHFLRGALRFCRDRVNDLNYFKRVKLAIVAPVAIVGLIVIACVLWASCTSATPSHSRARHRQAIQGSEPREGCCVRGLWMAAPIALFCLDLIYPAITRTLLQFFTCRTLGDSGKWLEVDCTFSAWVSFLFCLWHLPTS